MHRVDIFLDYLNGVLLFVFQNHEIMSFASLPHYTGSPLIIPSHLQSLAVTDAHGHNDQRTDSDENDSVAEFVKQTRNGGISLHLLSPEGNASLPTYGHSGTVEGTVIISRPEDIISVDVKVCTLWCKSSKYLSMQYLISV